MARMKFLCDAERCIECNACVTACKNEHEVPWGVNRRRVVTIQDGKPGERSISVACMHCSDAPCMAVCPVDCFYQTDQGVVLHSKDLCIGCGYCFYACPFGAPQFPQAGNYGSRGKMDKCTFCAGGPEANSSAAEFTKYGWNQLLKNNCIDIAQPEVCGLGGITEYLKVSALAQSNFIPIVNHVWGSALSVAVNLHLLTTLPDMPGGLFPTKSMLEFDTTEKNIFITDLAEEKFSILDQVKNKNGFASPLENIGIGINPNKDFIKKYEYNG